MANPSQQAQPSSSKAHLTANLHPKQWTALLSKATEVLYGGAAGGGKSYLMRMAAILWCAAIPGLQVYLFRRIRDDLVKNHMEGPKGFRALLAAMVTDGWCSIVEDEIRFWNGARIYLCHCKDAKDVYKYQGAEIHVLLIDELTHFEEAMYRFLRNRVRMVGIRLPREYEGQFPRILCGANPGNIGHQFVKMAFIDDAMPFAVRKMGDDDGGMLRQYIPAQLDDNPSMATDDPGYEARLSGLGSEALVRAMRYGDWDIIEGAFFDGWRREKHVIPPIVLPKDWLRFCSMDWGYAKPFSIGWWAVASDDFAVPGHGGMGGLDLNPSHSRHDGGYRSDAEHVVAQSRVVIPRGALVRYREWYGCKRDSSGRTVPDTGLRLTAEQVAQGIKERERGENINYRVIDPSAFAEDGGPSIAERMFQEGVTFRRADNKRVAAAGALGGWDQMRARFRGDGITPAMFIFETCYDFIRTVPALQHDPDRPEDLNTDMEDHAADDGRYAAMSRPYIPAKSVPKPPGRDIHAITMNEAWKLAENDFGRDNRI